MQLDVIKTDATAVNRLNAPERSLTHGYILQDKPPSVLRMQIARPNFASVSFGFNALPFALMQPLPRIVILR